MTAARAISAELIGEIQEAYVRICRDMPTWPTDMIHAAGLLLEEQFDLNSLILRMRRRNEVDDAGDVYLQALFLAAAVIRFLVEFSRYAEMDMNKSEVTS